MIKKISDCVYELSRGGKMLVPGIVFASEKLMSKIERDKTLEQVRNVACLPGIIEKSIAMPDAHQGYGMCVGGVAAFDLDDGVISPGGVGYDINCGVRVLVSNISKKNFLKKREQILNALYKEIPTGVGEKGNLSISDNDINEILEKGCIWALEKGYASKEDLEKIEDSGRIVGADAKKVSQRARARGKNQLGTLGSGNHFLEIQEVNEIFDRRTAAKFGLAEDGVIVMIHTGSRGLGHQTASDYILAMEKIYGTKNLPDRELACAPINSPIGKDYRAAMAAAANFAFVNRQIISYKVRQVFSKIFSEAKLEGLYDVAHNIAKFEKHSVGGKVKEICVHRKGATRSFGPGRAELPLVYRKIGQPILLPGSMGTASYVLLGTKEAEKISFASTAHGAGRVLSRSSAIATLSAKKVEQNLLEKNILIKAKSAKGIVEEAPEAYKDVDEVARVSDALGLGKLVARLTPLCVMKG